MTVPGVGALLAITFKSAVDDPGRFARSRVLGALAARSGSLGYRILIPPYGGSNPPAPAKQSGLSPAFSDRGAESPAFPGVHGSDSEPETGRAGLFSA